jgi:hypothetical protein
VDAEDILLSRGSCRYSICASCVSAENFLFFAWYLQLTFFCLICFWWVFTFSFWNVNETFCALCVCNMMFLFFLGICNSPLCALCVAAENFLFLRGMCRYSISASCVAAENFLLFAWYLELTYLCLIRFWLVFSFFIVILTIHFVLYVFVIWRFSLFSRYLRQPPFCFMRGRWEFSFLRGTCRYTILLQVLLLRIFCCLRGICSKYFTA